MEVWRSAMEVCGGRGSRGEQWRYAMCRAGVGAPCRCVLGAGRQGVQRRHGICRESVEGDVEVYGRPWKCRGCRGDAGEVWRCLRGVVWRCRECHGELCVATPFM